jgi:hypothetical protein
VNGEEVSLGSGVIVGMYDEPSGEGVIFGEKWIEAQLEELQRMAVEAIESMAYR